MRPIVTVCMIACILLLFIPGCTCITPESYISIDTPGDNTSVFAEMRDFYIIGSFSPDIRNPGDIRIELFPGDKPAGIPVRSIVSRVNESGVTARESVAEDYPNGTSFDYGLIMAPDIVQYPGGIGNASNKVVVTEDYFAGIILGGATKNFDTNYTWPNGTPLDDLTEGDYTILVTGLSGDTEGLTATKTIHFGLTHAALGRFSPRSQMDALTAYARENDYRLYTDCFAGYFIPPNAPSKLYEIKSRWIPNNAIEVVNDLSGTTTDIPSTAENNMIIYNVRNTSATNTVETASLIRYDLLDSDRTVFLYYDTGEPVIYYIDRVTGTNTTLTGNLSEFESDEKIMFTRADIRPKNNITDENTYIVGSENSRGIPVCIDTDPYDRITVTTGDEFCLFGVVKPIDSSLTPLEYPYTFMPDNRISTLRYQVTDETGQTVLETEKQINLGRVYDPEDPGWLSYSSPEFSHEFAFDTPGMYTMKVAGYDTNGDLVDDTDAELDITVRDTVNPSDEDASGDIETSNPLNAGDSAIFTFTGSAVQAVTITATEETGSILLTIDQTGNGPDGLKGSVYQYISAQLSGMTDEQIKEADFSFHVPTAWLKAEELLPTELALWRYHNGAWEELPTTIANEEGGWIYYQARTPGFSSFAIAEGTAENGVKDSGNINSDIDTGTAVDTDFSNPKSGNITTAEDPQVTISIPEDNEMPTDTATPQESPVGLIPILSAVGAIVLFRKR